uniref:Putative secreted protein n=1 Tax=Anopheles triannulatus TaxID=58253 RepID=A0A2M4B302_9DIPT
MHGRKRAKTLRGHGTIRFVVFWCASSRASSADVVVALHGLLFFSRPALPVVGCSRSGLVTANREGTLLSLSGSQFPREGTLSDMAFVFARTPGASRHAAVCRSVSSPVISSFVTKVFQF